MVFWYGNDHQFYIKLSGNPLCRAVLMEAEITVTCVMVVQLKLNILVMIWDHLQNTLKRETYLGLPSIRMLFNSRTFVIFLSPTSFMDFVSVSDSVHKCSLPMQDLIIIVNHDPTTEGIKWRAESVLPYPMACCAVLHRGGMDYWTSFTWPWEVHNLKNRLPGLHGLWLDYFRQRSFIPHQRGRN